MYNLGIDIGGTFIKYALVDETYKIIDKWKVETIKLETKMNCMIIYVIILEILMI